MGWPQDAFLYLRRIATPKGLPQPGGDLLYVKSDGYVYTRDSSGVEHRIDEQAANALAAHIAATTAHGTAGTVVGTSDTQTLTNKTVNLSSNTLSGTTAQFNTALSDDDFATLTNTVTLTNKTLSTGTKVGASSVDISGAWASFTPTWTGLTIGNATVDAKYMQVGKRVDFFISVTMGSTTTFGANWTATLPVTARIAGEYRFNIGMKDVSAGNNYIGTTFNHSTTLMNLAATGGTNGLLPSTITSTVPFAWAVSDLLTISGTYEAA